MFIVILHVLLRL